MKGGELCDAGVFSLTVGVDALSFPFRTDTEWDTNSYVYEKILPYTDSLIADIV